MKEFVSHHPWMTFFLGLATLNTIGYVVVARKATAAVPPPAPAKPATLTQGVLDHPMMSWSKPVTYLVSQ